MNILALVGSPRKGGNTDLLVETMLRGSRAGNHKSEKLYLYQYDISPCIDCRKCKKGDCLCTIDDGMQQVYPKMDAADVIIFGTPNYWFGPSAMMKLFIDRMRPYASNEKLKGKKAIIIIPAAQGPKACGPMVAMFRMSFDCLEMEFAGEIVAEAYERGEIESDRDVLKQAYDLGASL